MWVGDGIKWKLSLPATLWKFVLSLPLIQFKLAYVELPKKFSFHVQLVIQVGSLADATLQYEFYCFYANFDFIAIKLLLMFST